MLFCFVLFAAVADVSVISGVAVAVVIDCCFSLLLLLFIVFYFSAAAMPRAAHVLKLLLLWRPLSWWKQQQVQISLGLSKFRHPRRFRTMRWEKQFSKNWFVVSDQSWD